MQTATIAQSQVKEGGGSLLSGVLLIAGTAIGAGMLALPNVTGPAGFYPAMVMNVLCWLYMLATGLLLLEATLWMKEGANVLTIAGTLLGPIGKIVGGVTFLFLYYCYMVSYLSGGSPLFVDIVEKFTRISWNSTCGFCLFALVPGIIVFLGTKLVDRLNGILMAGLIISYLLLVGIGYSEMQPSLLIRREWSLTLLAAPTFFSAYGYHNIIPSLASYMKRDRRKLRWTVILGTSIPFIVYSLWQWLILGAIPQEQLQEAVRMGVPISQTLQEITGHSWIRNLTLYFGFFALVTSLLSIALSMVDFLGDGLRVKSTGLVRLALCLLVFVPPALFAAYNPGIFAEAVGVAGGFGEAILNGLLPIALVWVGRYYLKKERADEVPGGRWTLAFLLGFTLLIMGMEAVHLLT